MRAMRLAGYPAGISGAALLIAGAALAAGAAFGLVPAAAAGTGAGQAGLVTALTFPGTLSGVVATSARNAWAVGLSGRNALIERWNGMTWKPVPSPRFKGTSILTDVAAAAASDAWAVGGTGINTGTPKTLIEHWNGRAWR